MTNAFPWGKVPPQGADEGPLSHGQSRASSSQVLPPSMREVAERKRSRREFRSKEGHPLSHGLRRASSPRGGAKSVEKPVFSSS